MTPPPVVILAGGASRRMGGGDKTLRMLGGRPLLCHVIDRVEPQCTALALNTNSSPGDFAPYGLPILPDTQPDRPGPLAGILTAMTWAERLDAARVITVPGDTPFLPGDLVPQLMLRAETTRGPVLARSGGRTHPVAGLWPVALGPTLAEAIERGTRRVMDWAESRGAVTVDFPSTSPDPFFNVNTPDDLSHAEAALKTARQV